MDATKVFFDDDLIKINFGGTILHVFTWEEFDELEVAFDVVRRLSGGIKEKRLLVTIKDQKE